MTRRSRTGAALVLGGAFFAMASDGHAASQLFKCVDGGRTVYQQQACPLSAQGEPTASASRSIIAKADAASAAAPSASAQRLKPASLAASSALAKPR